MSNDTTTAVQALDKLIADVNASQLSQGVKDTIVLTATLMRTGRIHRDAAEMDDVTGLIANFERLQAVSA
jgi:hypothetical protein